MKHAISEDDLDFKNQLESCKFPVDDFDHRGHLRLAYIYLVENDPQTSVALTRDTLIRLLKHVGVDPSAKYHETMTEAWILAVHHFMNKTPAANSADEFIDQHPEMLDSKIMMTHYSEKVLFSDQARTEFVEPNLEPIPRYA